MYNIFMNQRKIKVIRDEKEDEPRVSETIFFKCICRLNKENKNKECIGVCEFD